MAAMRSQRTAEWTEVIHAWTRDAHDRRRSSSGRWPRACRSRRSATAARCSSSTTPRPAARGSTRPTATSACRRRPVAHRRSTAARRRSPRPPRTPVDELPWDRATPRRAGPESGPTGRTGPLAGLRVLDLTAWWAGPAATGLFAALGADVIHVEAPARMDNMRLVGALFFDRPEWWELSSFFLAINVNKRDLTLDLASDEGRRLALDLIAHCDVVVENFTPRVLDKLGLGWDADPRGQPAGGARAHARLRARRPVARPARVRADDGAGGRSGVDHRPTRRPAPHPARTVRSQRRGARRVRRAASRSTERDRTGRGEPGRGGDVRHRHRRSRPSRPSSGPPTATWSSGTATGRRGPHRRASTRRPGPTAGRAVGDERRGVAGAHRRSSAGPTSPADERARRPSRAAAVAPRRARRRRSPSTCAARPRRGGRRTPRRRGAGGRGQRPAPDGHPPATCAARGYFEDIDHPVAGVLPDPRPAVPGRPASSAGAARPAPRFGQHNHDILGGLLGLPDDELARLEAAGVIASRPAGF